MPRTEQQIREDCAKHIRAIQTSIDVLQQSIRDYAQLRIPDFHFMSHQVSTFWTCEDSPIGMCVFRVEMGRPTTCYYCDGPTERK